MFQKFYFGLFYINNSFSCISGVIFVSSLSDVAMDLFSYICVNFSRKKRLFSSFLRTILSEKLGKSILGLLCINGIVTVVLLYHCGSTNSMALTAFSYLSIFSILRLCSCFVSIWVHKQRASFEYSFGYERFEVLSVFVCTALSQLSAFFILKESFERLIQPDKVSHESQILMVIVGSIMNFVVIHAVENKPFDLVSRAASSNWVQDFLFDCGKSVCGIPLLSKLLLSRINPYVLLSNMAATAVVIETLIIENSHSYEADTIAAMFIAILICVTMYPLSVHCAMVLLQAGPKEIMSSIDKCLKEANTLDGLLEFRQEHFWSVSFGKYAGMIHVRIRRDANEQLILAQLTNQLAPYLHYTSIQIFKDDWKKNSDTEINIYTSRQSLPFVSMKPTKTSMTTNGYPQKHFSDLQTNRPLPFTNKHTPKAHADANRKVKYKGPKIDIDFG